MNSSKTSIASGLYNANTAANSSMFETCNLINKSFIPALSTWKTPLVIALRNNSYDPLSISNFGLLIFTSNSVNPASISASFTVFNVATPRISNLIIPISSTIRLST